MPLGPGHGREWLALGPARSQGEMGVLYRHTCLRAWHGPSSLSGLASSLASMGNAFQCTIKCCSGTSHALCRCAQAPCTGGKPGMSEIAHTNVTHLCHCRLRGPLRPSPWGWARWWRSAAGRCWRATMACTLPTTRGVTAATSAPSITRACAGASRCVCAEMMGMACLGPRCGRRTQSEAAQATRQTPSRCMQGAGMMRWEGRSLDALTNMQCAVLEFGNRTV